MKDPWRGRAHLAAMLAAPQSLLAIAGPAALAAQPNSGPTLKTAVHTWGYWDALGDQGVAAPGRNPSGFRVRRVNIYVTGQATDTIGYNVLFDPALLLTNSTLTVRGNVSGSSITSSAITSSFGPLKDAYVFYDNGYIRLQAGQMKVPISEEFLQSAVNLATVERSAFATSAQTGDFGFYRDIGALGSVHLGAARWYLGIYNGSGANIAENSERKTAVTRLEITPLDHLRLGASYLNGYKRGPADSAALFRNRVGANAQLDLAPVRLSTEALFGTDAGQTDRPKLGWYGQAVYAAGADHQLVFKVEGWNPDLSTGLTGGTSKQQYSALLGWNWSLGAPGARFQLNYIHDFLPSGSQAPALGILPGGANDRVLSQFAVVL